MASAENILAAGYNPSPRVLAALGASLLLHAAAIVSLHATAIVQPEADPPVLISLRPGGGGGGGRSEPVAARAPEEASAPAVQAVPPPPLELRPKAPKIAAPKPKPVPKPVARQKAPVPAMPAAEQSQAEALNSHGSDAAGTEGVGGGTGSGSGIGSGSGEGSGSGSGPGRGSGPGGGGDSRAYCTYCPEPDYPRIARQRGWQGTVDIAIRLLANGGVDHVSVRRSSGYGALDEAALEVARVSRFTLPQSDGPLDPLLGRIEYRFVLSRAR